MEWNYISISHMYHHGGGGGRCGGMVIVHNCMEGDSMEQPQLVSAITDRSCFTQFLGCCSTSIEKFTQLLNLRSTSWFNTI
jgi:hypothetical protein